MLKDNIVNVCNFIVNNKYIFIIELQNIFFWAPRIKNRNCQTKLCNRIQVHRHIYLHVGFGHMI